MEAFLSPDHLPLYLSIPAVLIVFFALGFMGAPNWLWTIFFWAVFTGYIGWCMLGTSIILGVCLLFVIVPIRRALITGPLMKMLMKLGLLPEISQTEREAIDAGTVWVEKEFFSGKPNFNNIMNQTYGKLSEEEQAFLDGPTQKLCDMVHDWDVQCDGDLPPEAWEFIKKEKLLGMFGYSL